MNKYTSLKDLEAETEDLEVPDLTGTVTLRNIMATLHMSATSFPRDRLNYSTGFGDKAILPHLEEKYRP